MMRTQSQNEPRRGLPLRRNIDIGNLTTSKLPNVEPVVPPDNYLNWRYTNSRGATNLAFDRVQQLLKNRAQNAIENFERKLKKEADRQKNVNKQISNATSNYNDKYSSLRTRWMDVKGRQSTDASDRLMQSDQFYSQNLKDIKDRRRQRSNNDDTKSLTHQTSIASAREKRKSVI